MRTFVLLICLAGSGLAARAQTGFLTGTLLNPANRPAPGFKIEAKNVATGTYYQTTSAAKGEYTFAQLPAGTYQVSVLNLLFRPYVREGVIVLTASSAHLDIQLAEDTTGDTLGDIPGLLALSANRPPPPQGPPPRMPDGKPDLSGAWVVPAGYLAMVVAPPVELLPWAEAKVRERILNHTRDMPSARCLPGSEELMAMLPVKYVQTPTLLVQLAEDVPAAHQVYLDGRSHPADLDPTWRGHSIGNWDGDTLVIDTVGYNDKSWLFVIIPHTDKLHKTERLRRVDLGHLEVETTYEDQGTFKKPVTYKMIHTLAPNEDIDEFVCENNQYIQHVSVK
jgi:hypothetical protein